MQEPPLMSLSTLRPWTENHGKLHHQDCQWPRPLGNGDKESCLVKFAMGKGNMKEVKEEGSYKYQQRPYDPLWK